MAALPTTLPAIPLGMGADDTGRQEYLTALQQVMSSLQERQKPNFFAIGSALLNPGRTGNAGEALSNASAEMGRQQAQQEQAAPSIAMMKASIAGQKYELANQAKALELMGQALGTTPEVAGAKVQEGNLSMDEMQKLARIYPTIATMSPKVGEIIKNVFSMSTEMGKVFESQRGEAGKQAGMVAETPGVQNLIPPKYRLLDPTAQGTPPPAPPPPANSNVGPSVAPAVVPSVNPNVGPAPSPMSSMPRDQQLANYVGSNLLSDTNQPPPATPNVNQQQATVPNVNPDAGLSLKSQAAIAQKRVEESDKIFALQREEIYRSNPQVLSESNSRLRQLDTWARQSPEVFALMQKQGFLSGLASLAQEGVNMQVNQYQGRLGVNVNDFLRKVKLDPDQQQVVRDVTRILGAEFLTNARTNRGLLGVNPTDNDAKLLQAPMASLDDSARAMQMWTREQLLSNKQRDALYNGLQNHDKRFGTAAPPASFFQSNDYTKTLNDYSKYREQLFKQFYPE